MEKELHIVNGLKGFNSVQKLGSQEQKKNRLVVSFLADFSRFYLPKDGSREEILKTVYNRPYLLNQDRETLDFWKRRGFPECRIVNDLFEYMLTFATHNYYQYDKVYIWHGKDSSSILMMYYLSGLIKSERLFEVDVARSNYKCWITWHNGFTLWDLSNDEFKNECSNYKELATHIDSRKRALYMDRWKSICNSAYPMRVVNRQGRVVGKRYSLIDKYILEALENHPNSNVFDIGDYAMRKQPYTELGFHFLHSEGFVWERIASLANQRIMDLIAVKHE